LLCFGSCRAKVSIFGVREVKLPKKKNCNVPQMTKITLQKINNKKKKKITKPIVATMGLH
jgi:hypothetical protein